MEMAEGGKASNYSHFRVRSAKKWIYFAPGLCRFHFPLVDFGKFCLRVARLIFLLLLVFIYMLCPVGQAPSIHGVMFELDPIPKSLNYITFDYLFVYYIAAIKIQLFNCTFFFSIFELCRPSWCKFYIYIFKKMMPISLYLFIFIHFYSFEWISLLSHFIMNFLFTFLYLWEIMNDEMWKYHYFN